MFHYSAANKYYSSVGHYEQKNKKTTVQIKFSTVTVKQQIKLVLGHSLCKEMWMYWFRAIGSNGVAVSPPVFSV